MSKILFVVESPGKLQKIKGYLGNDYIVDACVGIFRDLDPKPKSGYSIDIENGFEPQYIITKPDVVKKLKAQMARADILYLATDNDTEGHGMAKALIDVLRPKKYKRVLFNEISKTAILDGIKNAATKVDENKVSSQKTRRIIDRFFGYGISKIVNRKTGGKSAGRTQSTATRFIVDRENEINAFIEKNSDSSSFKVSGKIGDFKCNLYGFGTECAVTDKLLKSEYKGKTMFIRLGSDEPNKYVTVFLKKCLKSTFKIHSVSKKEAMRSPSPPFITSSLQQEAYRKHGLAPENTMRIAQRLYEAGYITYMRTDSVMISEEGHKGLKEVIEKEYGKNAYRRTEYKTKNKSAQLAHECVRPVHPDIMNLEDDHSNNDISNDIFCQKLYRLIWKRAIASQMQPAKVDVTTIQIDISKYFDNPDQEKNYYYFQSSIEKVTYKGFMEVYVESTDDEDEKDGKDKSESKSKIPDIKIPQIGSVIVMREIIAKQDFLKAPVRYTQASLVKKLEDSGIGRPSTTANTVKVILDRKYVEITDVPGIKKQIMTFSIGSKNGKHVMSIDEKSSEVLMGNEKKKLVPTGLGKSVTEYLVSNFTEFVDYGFTAKMEADMDEIEEGNKNWKKVVSKFYSKMTDLIDKIGDDGQTIYSSSARELGKDPDGNLVVALKTKNGAAISRTIGKEIQYANIPDDKLDKIKLKEAIACLEDATKNLGVWEGFNVYVKKSKKGPYYISYGKKEYCPIDEDVDHTALKLKHAIKLITAHKKKSTENLIKEFTIREGKITYKAQIVKGKGTYPPYIQTDKNGKREFCSLQGLDPQILGEKEVLGLIKAKRDYLKNKRGSGSKTNKKDGTKSPIKKAGTKKTPVKKTPAKKTPAKKTPAKKTPAKKTPAKKTPAKKTPAKKTPARKPASKAPVKK